MDAGRQKEGACNKSASVSFQLPAPGFQPDDRSESWQLVAGNWKLQGLINGTLHRTGLPAVPARRNEALSQRRALLYGEVRDREAQFAARAARKAAEGKARRLRPAAP